MDKGVDRQTDTDKQTVRRTNVRRTDIKKYKWSFRYTDRQADKRQTGHKEDGHSKIQMVLQTD